MGRGVTGGRLAAEFRGCAEAEHLRLVGLLLTESVTKSGLLAAVFQKELLD